MKKRYRYSYSIFDLAYNFLVPAKVLCCCKNKLKSIHTRYKLFQKGREKYERELDVVEFAKYQRKLKMLMHWLMNKSERFLAAYQKSNAISLSTESENQSDDPAYTQIPKMFDNDKVKLIHHDIVNRFFNEYLKEPHTFKDENLLHGVYTDKQDKIDEHELKWLINRPEINESKYEFLVKESNSQNKGNNKFDESEDRNYNASHFHKNMIINNGLIPTAKQTVLDSNVRTIKKSIDFGENPDYLISPFEK